MEENFNQENSQTVVPEVKVAPAVPIPTTSGNWWKWGILMVGLVLAGSIAFAGWQISQKQSVPVVVSPTNIPLTSSIPQVTLLPSPTPDETANWKTYEGVTAYSVNGNTKFSIKYPSDWALKRMEEGRGKGDLLFPLGDINADIINYKAPYILLGAGGHGGGCETIIKTYPAGEARYCWGEYGGMVAFDRNNVSYIFEAYYYGNPQNLSNKEYERIFNLILSTFKFLE